MVGSVCSAEVSVRKEKQMERRRIEFKDVSFSYEAGQKVLDRITFSLQGNESIGLIGANGVGKSTLLKLMVGLCPVTEGEIWIDGLAVTEKNLPGIREKTGYVFQDSDSQLFMTTVFEDVAFAPRNYGLGEEEVKKRVETALEMVHISHLREKQIYKMSGGEKKLVTIATVLSMKPSLMLLDEPTVALDPGNRSNLISLLNGFTFPKIITSHDLDMIWDTCERTILLYDGKIQRDGDTREILQDRELLEDCGPYALRFCKSKRQP